jgi:hypothetical protein
MPLAQAAVATAIATGSATAIDPFLQQNDASFRFGLPLLPKRTPYSPECFCAEQPALLRTLQQKVAEPYSAAVWSYRFPDKSSS